MSDPIVTNLGSLDGIGAGNPVFAVEGDHACTVTVTGSGSVSAAVAWQGSNDGVGWVTLATLSPAGTTTAAEKASATESYRYWRMNALALTGTRVTAVIASEAASGAAQSPVSGAGTPILDSATAGQDSGWIAYTPGMRLAYVLDSGSTATAFSVDISADGSTSLGQAFTGTWNSTTAEISPPIWLSNPAARFIRFNVLGAGPLSVIRF